jgi:hypothetical protein
LPFGIHRANAESFYEIHLGAIGATAPAHFSSPNHLDDGGLEPVTGFGITFRFGGGKSGKGVKSFAPRYLNGVPTANLTGGEIAALVIVGVAVAGMAAVVITRTGNDDDTPAASTETSTTTDSGSGGSTTKPKPGKPSRAS